MRQILDPTCCFKRNLLAYALFLISLTVVAKYSVKNSFSFIYSLDFNNNSYKSTTFKPESASSPILCRTISKSGLMPILNILEQTVEWLTTKLKGKI